MVQMVMVKRYIPVISLKRYRLMSHRSFEKHTTLITLQKLYAMLYGPIQ